MQYSTTAWVAAKYKLSSQHAILSNNMGSRKIQAIVTTCNTEQQDKVTKYKPLIKTTSKYKEYHHRSQTSKARKFCRTKVM